MTLLDVVEKIALDLATNPHINAMWLEGSWATGKNNDQSDIDVWLDVADDTLQECIDTFRNALTKTGNIDWEQARGIYSQKPKLQKQTFHLAGFPKSQQIELDLQEHSRNFLFHKNEHVIRVLFDKNHTIKWQSA